MIAKFFIERPVLANVIAVLTVILGLVALARLPVAQYPNIVPPTVQVTARYPGASAATVVARGGAADRAEGQRRRGHDLHVVDEHQRRHLHAHRHLQDRHRRATRRRSWCRTGSASALAVAAAGRADAGRADRQALDLDPRDRRAELARRPLRQPVPVELCDHQSARRDRPPRRRRQRRRCSAPASTPCGSGSIRRSCRRASWSCRRHQRRQSAEPQRPEPGSSACRPCPHGQDVPIHDQRAEQARRRRPVRGHHHQGGYRRERPHHAVARRGDSRARRAAVQPDLQAQRPAVGRHRHLPAPRGQRARCRQARRAAHERAAAKAFPQG